VGAKIIADDLRDLEQWAMGVLMAILISLGGVLVSIIPIFATNPPKEYVKYETAQIIALKDNENINGRCYLMGGYVDEDLYYSYALQTENGIKIDKVNASEGYIVYSNEKPKIEKYKVKRFKHWYSYLYSIPMGEYYNIYVPKGTVTNEYEVDLE
jgi:hypothetical protein